MPGIAWTDALEYIMRYVARIETPDAQGTGFLVAKRIPAVPSPGPPETVVATAYHVVKAAIEAQQPIVIQHLASRCRVEISPAGRDLTVQPERDLALINCSGSQLAFAGEAPRLAASHLRLKPGSEIGWCGFPDIEGVGNDRLCFFGGYVSTLWSERGDYLVDGVAIHGVSGGPAFEKDSGAVTIVGLVSAYIPNLAVEGVALPGVCSVTSVADIVELFDRSTAEARRRAHAVQGGTASRPRT
jgi:hypothetical protein